MSKAFTKETDAQDDDLAPELQVPVGAKNYITPAGHRRLHDELMHLMNTERPQVVSVVSWAASNGDRSENGDYLYGKKRLREIDRRIRFLTKRLEAAEVVDPAAQDHGDQIFFGARVQVLRSDGTQQNIRIVGVDEVDTAAGDVSWISPIARALIKAREGDTVNLRTPSGVEELEVLSVHYNA
jgi:transcription elongation factor GreB